MIYSHAHYPFGTQAIVDASFKVTLNLPNWSEKLALVIDNDDEDEVLLNYESNYIDNNQ